MYDIYEKLRDKAILDSEMIQDIECRKGNDPNFDIYLGDVLSYAVYRDRRELVRYLLLSVPDINVNHRNYYDESTALYYCDKVSNLKLLLSHRHLDVNIQNNMGETGLHRICYWGHKACVRELLVDARINTYIRNYHGEMTRDIALERGYPSIAKIVGNSGYTTLLRIPTASLLHDIVRMIIEEYV